jgi:xanthine dehydrogenase/oxidase
VCVVCPPQVLPAPPAHVAVRARASLSFFVNQVLVEPDLDTVPLDLPLANFLRERLGLTGTKIGCGEGGCGACTVLLSYTDVVSGDLVSVPVNSCLRPVLACDGMSITTIEGIGSSVKGYHPVQERCAWCMC